MVFRERTRGSSTDCDPGLKGGVIPDVPGDTSDDPEVNMGQRWILDQLRAEARLRRGDVEEKFRCSAKTAKRDLAALADRGLCPQV